MTRHPRMGAVEELKVTLREPQSNQRLSEKCLSQVAVEGTLRLLCGNHRGISVEGEIGGAIGGEWNAVPNAEYIAAASAVLCTG